MAIIQESPFNRQISERTESVPFFLIKTLNTEEAEMYEEYENHPKLGYLYNLTAKVAVDRDFLQRLIKAWPKAKRDEYLRDYYLGYDCIDAYVLVSVVEILRVLRATQEKLDDKSTLTDFISKLEEHSENGIEWLMINGQHRDDIWQDVWNSDKPFPSDFNNGQPIEGEVIGGKTWNDISLQTRCHLLNESHLITFVEKFTDMSDLKTLVKRHNEGNVWNAHEDRIIEPSYMAQIFNSYDEDETLIKLFNDTLKAKGSDYEAAKRGISYLMTQMYYVWETGRKEGVQVLSINDSKLDDLVKIGSTKWTKPKVNQFVKFFVKCCDELNNYFFRKLKKEDVKKWRGMLRFKISTLRHYMMYRMSVDGLTNISASLDDNGKIEYSEYTILDTKKFVDHFIKGEIERLLPEENLTPDGRKLFDNTPKDERTSKFMKQLVKEYKSTDSYAHLVSSSSSSTAMNKIISRIYETFKNDLDTELKGVVKKKGEDVSQSQKARIRAQAALAAGNDVNGMINAVRGDIGHMNTPKSIGGNSSDANLGVQNVNENRRQQDNH